MSNFSGNVPGPISVMRKKHALKYAGPAKNTEHGEFTLYVMSHDDVMMSFRRRKKIYKKSYKNLIKFCLKFLKFRAAT